MTTKSYRRYDPRLKNLVAESGDIKRFLDLGIPPSTLRQWIHNGIQDFFTLPELQLSTSLLIGENLELKSRLKTVLAEQDLVTKTIKIFGFQIQYKRLPSSEAKGEIMEAIKSAAIMISLQKCLDAIGLSAARYHHWLKRQINCQLSDQSSCPRVSPSQLTSKETNKIKELYLSTDLAHFSMTSLSWLGKKTGDIVASISTWSRVIRQLGLKRNRIRIYPEKPKIGIRASRPGEIWHLDLSILRLQDGSRVFIQAIIDNFSRYVLAWKVSPDYGGLRTKDLLHQAISKAKILGLDMIPNVFVDSGTENMNHHVNSLVASNLITRIVAQIDIEFSNSMIEMLFLRLKHRHLFNIPLSNFDAVVKGVDFYMNESNDCIPHSALKGATPNEVITGRWTEDIIAALHDRMIQARKSRSETNLAARCQPCLA